jgi:malonyl CoA-acyl carrier protein transacylase
VVQIGSVKSQIGHTKAAAGAAGLVKAVLALHAKTLPPTIKVEQPEPEARTRQEPLPRHDACASVGAPREPSASRIGELVRLRRFELPHRARRVRRPREGRVPCPRARQRARSASTPNGIFFGVGGRQGDVGFVFPGQGSQSIDMGAHIAMTFDDAAHAWDLTRKVDFGADVSLHEVVYPKTVFNPADKAANDARLTATEWAQPAIGAASLALLELTKRIGLSPVAVAGHSFGEVTALHAAGAITDADLLRIARKRGELMRDAAANTSGSMTAVVAKIEDLRPKLEAWGIDVVVANHNAPEQVVLSGATSAIEAVEKKLADAGITAKRLNVATAFHSKLVSPSTVPFRAFLEGIDVSAPSLDVFANATAAPYGSDVAGIRAQLGEQIANSVRFVECVEAMYARGVRTFVEVGPGAVLSGLVGRILKGRPHRAVALDRSGRDGVTAFYTGIAQLVADGESLALGTLWEAFAPLEDPRTTTKPKLLLKINGANYGKPYPPKGGSAALPKPNKKSTITVGAPSVATLSADVTKPVAHANGTNGNGNGKNGGSHAATTTPARTEARVVAAAGAGGLQMISGSSGGAPRAQLSAEGAPTQQPAQAQQAPSVIAAQPAAANGAWLDAYRAAQSSAAEAHSAYQRAMAETHSAFLRTAEASIHGLTSLVTGTRPAAPVVRARAGLRACSGRCSARVRCARACVRARSGRCARAGVRACSGRRARGTSRRGEGTCAGRSAARRERRREGRCASRAEPRHREAPDGRGRREDRLPRRDARGGHGSRSRPRRRFDQARRDPLDDARARAEPARRGRRRDGQAPHARPDRRLHARASCPRAQRPQRLPWSHVELLRRRRRQRRASTSRSS